jgi:hypothetical protein
MVSGSVLSLVSGNSMSRWNQLSWKWRHMARKSAVFLRTRFLPSTSSSNIIAQWWSSSLISKMKNMASKISILKDIYLENRFICNKLEAILFEEMRRIGLLREIGKYTASLL